MSFSVNVDPCNPGQFFACCGLLELADRLWDGAEGKFSSDLATFSLWPLRTETDSSASRFIGELAKCRLANTMTTEQVSRLEQLQSMTGKERAKTPGLDEEKKALEKLWRESPLVLHEPFDLRLDWFLDKTAGGSRFKTWAGQQCVIDIALAMKRPVESGDWNNLPPTEWLSRATDDEGLPFNFDSDLASQSSALDMGFSLDPLKISPRSRPFLELAAFIGLQRFRAFDAGDNRYTFVFWLDSLPPELASVAACGVLGVPGWRVFDFRLLYRTEYLKSFLPAQPIRGAL